MHKPGIPGRILRILTNPKLLLLVSFSLVTVGVLCFLAAAGNEVLTFLGFATFVPGLVLPAVVFLKKLLRKLPFWLPAAIVASLLLFVFSTLAFVTFFFPNETVRQLMQEEIAKTLRRPVSIAGLRVSLLEGISLTGLEIKDRNGRDTFLSVKSFVLSYRLLPILVGRLEIDQAVLDSPEIYLRRAGDGSMNIDDLLAMGGPSAAAEPPAVAAPDTEAGGMPTIPLAIRITQLGMKRGKVSVSDLGTPGFENRYEVADTDFLIDNLNWPAVDPLGIRFNFRLRMTELAANGKETGKTFTLMPGFQGKMVLLGKGGQLAPTGHLTFFAEDGFFKGQQFLERGNAFLDDLKRDFFKAVSGEALKRMDQFDRELAGRVRTAAGDAEKQVAGLSSAARKDLEEGRTAFAKRRAEIEKAFGGEVGAGNSKNEQEARALEERVRKIHEGLLKLYPKAAGKVKVDGYLAAARKVSDDGRQRYATAAASLQNGLAQDMQRLLDSESAASERYIAGLTTGLAAHLDGYARQLRARFLAELSDLEKAALAYQLALPFLAKELSFRRVDTTIRFEEGRLLFNDLKIGGADFSVTAAGSFGMLDSSLELDLALRAAASWNKNELTGLFAEPDGSLLVEFEVRSGARGTTVRLKGPSVFERMKGALVAKVTGFIKDYLERNVNPTAIAEGFAKAIGGAPSLAAAVGKLDGLAATRRNALAGQQKQYSDALQNEEKRIETEMKKEAQAAATGSLPSLPGGLRPR